jgi:hypothetical protein
MSDEIMQDFSNNGKAGFVERQSDPNISPAYSTPGDFSAQWATPLDPTEILAMAEEATLVKFFPVLRTMLKEETWREMNVLAFTSGSAYVSFQDGACPEEFYHSGANTTVTLKTQGAKKSLSISDIMHSQFAQQLPMGMINAMTNPVQNFEGLPGVQGMDSATIGRIASMKEQEILLASLLVINGTDKLNVTGNKTTNSLEYDGLDTWLSTGSACHVPATITGTFSALNFDRFLSEGTVRPTVLVGHPTALQELQAGYFQLGFQASQNITFADGNRITPGFSFSNSLNTSQGALSLVADLNVPRTNTGGSTFRSPIYALRMSYNGTPLVYIRQQIPLSIRDLAPGCTAIAFSVWQKQSLVIRHACAHSRWESLWSGRIVTTSPLIGA